METQMEIKRLDEFKRKFEVWRTITLGSYSSVEELKDTIQTKLGVIEEVAEFMLDSKYFKISETPKEIKLSNVTVGELGFNDKEQPTLEQIYERAEKYGLKLCPDEVAPLVKLEFHQEMFEPQDFKGWLVAMVPYCNNEGTERYLFRIKTTVDQKLNRARGLLEAVKVQDVYATSYHFIFCR